MAVLNYRDPGTGQWVPLPNIAGPTGPAGPVGSVGPAGPPSEEIVVQAAEPTDPVLDLWIDIDEVVPPLDVYTKTETDAAFVNVAGDTMTGALDMGGFPVAGVGTGTIATDAANKGYVDSRIWYGTQAAYDAIVTKDPATLYVVTG